VDEFPYPKGVTKSEQNGLMECILVLMHFMFLTLVGDDELDQQLIKVRTRRALDAQSSPHSQLRFWRAPVVGNASGFALHYDLRVGALSIKAQEQNLPQPNAFYGEVAAFVAQQVGMTLANQSILLQVNELLRSGISTERDIAAKLNMSTRTLRRRLDRDGQSFRALVDEVKNTQACELIQNAAPIAAIAEKLGYADERSFRRAFIRWNKQSPSQYRKEHCLS
ncbi:MAG: helix-turn-helix domain-containing protein, partial [Pseudomonadota bacterium]